MSLEVEQKFAVGEFAAVEQKLLTFGATPGGEVQQADLYFAHPARDFSQTDEALRIRRVGQKNYVTYKGPKVDQATKTRQEIEIDLAPGQPGFEEFAALLAALGFRPVAEIRKCRRTLELRWQGHDVEAALDQVERVGTFVELEIIADEKDIDAARASLAALAAELHLGHGERRSYLELLLAGTG